MTREEKIICKDFLNDADKTHSCNEYKLLMELIEQEPILDKLRAEIVELQKEYHEFGWAYDDVLDIIDKYKVESENHESTYYR